MARKMMLVALLAVVVVAVSGCASTGAMGIVHRGLKHLEWHILGAYKDLINIHKDIDRYVFNLDERNPDRY